MLPMDRSSLACSSSWFSSPNAHPKRRSFAASLLSPLNSPKIAWWARIPFSLALDDFRSVLAVKGSLRRFAPWTAPGFGFLIRWIYPQIRRSYYLFFN